MSARPLALLAVAATALLGAALIGWLVFSEPAHDDLAPTPQELRDARPEGGAKRGEALPGATETTTETTRQAVAGGPASTPKGGGLRVVGRIVGNGDRPVAGATIAWSPRGRISLAALRDVAAEFGADSSEVEADLDDFEGLLDGMPDADAAGALPESLPDSLRDRLRGGAADAGDSRRAVSASDGRFELEIPVREVGARTSVRVSARGYRRADRPIDASKATGETPQVDLGDIRLERGILVSGRVVGPDGDGVAGARVARVDGGPSLPAGLGMQLPGRLRTLGGERTGDGGEFELLLREPGDFELVATHDLYPDATYRGQAGEDARTRGEIHDVILRLPRGATIAGRVTGIPDDTKGLQVTARRVVEKAAAPKPADGGEAESPFAGLLGAAFEQIADGFGLPGEREVTVGADGTFSVQGLAPGETYDVWAMHGRGMLGGQPCTPATRVPSDSRGVQLAFDPGAQVTFQVVDAESSDPVTTYRVAAGLERKLDFGIVSAPFTNTQSVRVKPDAEGRVRVGGLRPQEEHGLLTLRVRADGYDTLEKSGIRLPRAGSLDLGVLRLQPSAAIRVRVIAAEDGKPVASARVRLNEERADATPDRSQGPSFDFNFSAGGRGRGLGGRGRLDRASTGEDGWCTLYAPRTSRVVLSVEARDFAPHRGEAFSIGGAATVERQIDMTRGGSVEVTVVAGADGAPASGITIEHRVAGAERGGRSSQKTGAAGTALFERLEPGEHWFRVARRRGNRMFDLSMVAGELRRSTEDAGWETVQVVAGARAELTLRPPGSASLRGVVTENGAPLPGARVRIVAGRGGDGEGAEAARIEAAFGAFADRIPGGGRGGAKTDERGEFHLTDVPVGEHRLRVTHDSLATPKTVDVVIAPGENRHNVTLATASISGRITDTNGDPIVRAVIRVRREDAPEEDARMRLAGAAMSEVGAMFGLGRDEVRSGADGRYTVRGVTTGVPLIVTATPKKQVPGRSKAITLGAGEARTGIDFVLAEGGSVRIKIKAGGLMEMVRATRVGDETGEPRVQLARQGTAVLEGLEPGEWKLELVSEGGASERAQTVRVKAGEITRIEL